MKGRVGKRGREGGDERKGGWGRGRGRDGEEGKEGMGRGEGRGGDEREGGWGRGKGRVGKRERCGGGRLVGGMARLMKGVVAGGGRDETADTQTKTPTQLTGHVGKGGVEKGRKGWG